MEVNEQRFNTYLQRVMNNPEKYVIVPKKKGMKSPQAIHNERMGIVDRIETSLKLLDMRYDRNKYKIRVRLRQG